MDITLTLPPETERLLEQEARREGMDVIAYARHLIEAGLGRGHDAEDLAFRATLRADLQAFEEATSEERAAADREAEALMAGLNANREATGERPVAR